MDDLSCWEEGNGTVVKLTKTPGDECTGVVIYVEPTPGDEEGFYFRRLSDFKTLKLESFAEGAKVIHYI